MTISFIPYILPALFSSIFILIYFGIYRAIKISPRLLEIVIGMTAVSMGAIIIEPYAFDFVGEILGLIIAAPIIEESLKFIGTARKKDVQSGLAIGLGFALTENMLYFHAFLSGYFTSEGFSLLISTQAFIFIIIRGIFDPLLHSSLTGLSVRTWQKGKRFWLPVAIAFHAAYNFIAILGMTDISFLVIMDIAVLAPAVFLLLRKERKHEEREEKEISKEETKENNMSEPQPEQAPPPKIEVTTDLGSMELDQLIDYLRKTSSESGFEEIIKEAKIDTGGYEETLWIRNATLISGARKTTYTEIGPFGAFVIGGLAAISFVIVWVLFL